MLDIGWNEMMVIAIVAIVVIGPKELPGVLRGVGKSVTKLRKMAGDFRAQFDEALKEADLQDLKESANTLRETVGSLKGGLSPLGAIKNELISAGDAVTKPVTPVAANPSPTFPVMAPAAAAMPVAPVPPPPEPAATILPAAPSPPAAPAKPPRRAAASAKLTKTAQTEAATKSPAVKSPASKKPVSKKSAAQPPANKTAPA
jgi:sec-independent protein translocase protein TatB